MCVHGNDQTGLFEANDFFDYIPGFTYSLFVYLRSHTHIEWNALAMLPLLSLESC